MAALTDSFICVRLCCLLLFLLIDIIVTPACSPDEPPIVVDSVPGSLEDALRDLDPLHNCTVRLYLLSGEHIISSSVSVSAASVVLSSHPNNTARPVVRCGDNVSYPGDSVNETEEVGFLTFWKGARDVIISGVDFEGCPRTVQFIEVDRVNISDCTFRNFTQGPVNMYNCKDVTVSSSTFENNHAQSVFTDLPNRVSAGGLSITIYGNLTHSVRQGAFSHIVHNCTFSNNSANSSVATAESGTILAGGHINDRGGGMAIFVLNPLVVMISISKCIFIDNFAPLFGGGLYLVFPELATDGHFIAADSYFEENEAEYGGGITLGAAFLQTGVTENEALILEEMVTFTRNIFVKNRAAVGGAMRLRPGLAKGLVTLNVTYELSSNVFQENVATSQGAAVALSLRVAFTLLRTKTVTALNNTFIGNNGTAGGIVNAFHSPVHFQNYNRFINNIGPCIQASDTLIEVSGDMLWINNTAPTDGGAIYLTSHAQLRLHPSANLTFVSNRGSFGSAIVAAHPRLIPFPAVVLHNPLCFLIYSERNTLPQDQDVSLSFINNTAQVGSAMYLQNMRHCSFAGFEESSLPFEVVFRSDRFYYSGNENTGHPPDARGNTSFDISTPVAQIDIPNSTVFAYALESKSMIMHGLDELGNPTVGTFSITEKNERTLLVRPSASVVLPKDPAYKLLFVPLHKATINQSHNLNVQNLDRTVTASIILTHKACPAGFDVVLEGVNEHTCRCSSTDVNVISCNTSSEDILIRDWLWGTPITNSDGTNVLFTTSCSHGYCRCQPWYTDNRRECRFTVSQDLGQRDQQCTCNRQGFLCGSCVSGTGVTALLNKCKDCDIAHVTLIVFLVLVNAAIFLAILIYSLVKPIHLAAWWYPILFYIQVASYSTESFPVTFDSFRNVMFYLGSLLGLYFPYDFCLYPNATAVEVYAIKYIPFIVALVICTIFEVLARCCIKDPNRLNFSGMWLIAVLLINPALHTSFSILQCPTVLEEDGREMRIWLYDGTLQCFTKGHLPLSLWAGFVLAIYTVLMVLIPIVAQVKKCRGGAGIRTKALAEAASYPYAPKYWWWFLVNYTKQLLIISFTVYKPRTNVFEIMFLMLFYFLYAYARPYKSTYVNIIEIVLLAYLGIFLGLSSLEELQPMNIIQPDEPSTDSCGNEMPNFSPVGIVLGVVYFLPVAVLLFFLGKFALHSLKQILRTIFKRKLYTRGVVTTLSRAEISSTHSVANWNNVTEATVELVQYRNVDIEHELLID